MKLIKKLGIFSMIFCSIFAVIAIVHAKEITKQESLNNKIRNFINTTSIEVIDSYEEDDFTVYKIHDTINDKYFKLASNKNNEIDWYDAIKYGETTKILPELETKISKMTDNEEIMVLVELNFDYSSINKGLSKIKEEYFNENGIKTNLTKAEYTLGKEYKTSYIKEVMKNNNKLEGDYDITYVSQFSPFIFMNVNKDQLQKLIENESVNTINYISDEPLVLDYENSSITRAAIQNNAITATRINVVKNAGKTGSGIRIGQLELSNPNTSNSTLSGKSITKRTTNCSTASDSVTHATEVAGIMIGSNGVAPSASLYSACTTSQSDFASAVEWLINQNVDIINMSAGFSKGGYTSLDRWIDAITYMHDILFVKSSGNNSTPKNNVTSPGYSYNSFTVGNLNYTGSSYVDAMNASRAATSCYSEYGYLTLNNTPDLVVPATNVNYTNAYNGATSGTSFAAPLVAGANALLMQQSSSAKNNFLVAKAAIFASSRPLNNYPKKRNDGSGGFNIVYNHINNEVGVGMLDTKAASDLLSWSQYRTSTINVGDANTAYVFNNTLGNGMDVRVSLTWSRPVNCSSFDNCTGSSDRAADLELWIIGPNGEQIAKSNAEFDNVEWLNFVSNSGYGTYKFKVINWNSNGNQSATKFAMAWW